MCEFLFPDIEPFNTGYLKVSELHTIYYEEVGNPDGKPVVFLHGGPGAGLSKTHRRFFDPTFYRAILFDQRGTGKSLPFLETTDNTTWDLVEDIETLRRHLRIDKWLVFGGSWGSTLSLYYAETHPDSVIGIILRGIFLGRSSEIKWLLQFGASQIFPEKFEVFKNFIPENEQNDLLQAYYKRLTGDDKKLRNAAAMHYMNWEGKISALIPDDNENMDPLINGWVLTDATFECHYFINHMFTDSDNYLLENVFRIKDIPCRIIQGRYDTICPPISAWELHKALPNSEYIIVPDAGHLVAEPGIQKALVEATEDYKKLF